MYTQAQAWEDHCDYEANARYDYISEAYAATALDPWEEGYSDYCFDCEDQGDTPLSFADWKASQQRPLPAPPPLTWNDGEEIPF